MHGFRRDATGRACLAGAPIAELLRAANLSTPAYIYDLDAIEAGARELVEAFGASRGLVAYAVKANTAGTIVRVMAKAGTGADIVSGAELEVALACGIPPERIVMSGVAKTDAEIDRALHAGIRAIQAESVEELQRVAARARESGTTAPVSLRINPSVEVDVHSHIATGHDEAKFGIARDDVGGALDVVERNAELSLRGVSTHVGSMLKQPGPYLESATVVCEIAKQRLAAGDDLDFVDFGGGFGIDYGGGSVEAPAAFVRAALGLLKERGLDALALLVEPGRALVGPHGVLVANIVQTKRSGDQRWAMVDAGMNDLLRPALYQARHRIEPVGAVPTGPEWRVVGPVCESADDFGNHVLTEQPEGLVVMRDAGAYGFAMASEYNGRALPSEIFAAGGKVSHVSASPGAEAWIRSRLNA